MSNYDSEDSQNGIAIIGISGRFPGAENIDQFWENLCNGRESLTTFTDEELRESGVDPNLINNPAYIKSGPIVSDTDKFDAQFFGYSPREAEFMDPQQRIFLECAWNSLEDACCSPDNFDGTIGIFAGCSTNYYLTKNLLFSKYINSIGEFQTMIGNDKDFISTRAAYKLNLKGPAITVQTACSTSLVAVQMACQSLLNYQTDVALAGASTVKVPQKSGYIYQEGKILSPDGHCRAFDENASGTILGEGVGVVALKRLEDALEEGDNIYAVIKGAAINNDGDAKAGYTAPGVEGQRDVILTAQALAEVDGRTITYVETHGTGTKLGDPVEIKALSLAFSEETEDKNFCAIGSVKPNIGHLDSAAGIAGLIKTALALKYKKIPPSINFEKPNPECNFEDSPFYVNTTLSNWEPENNMPRRAGVSSFGIGGTNAHLILEEAPPVKEIFSKEENKPANWEILPFSAKSVDALKNSSKRVADYISSHPEINLKDIAHTLQNHRKEFSFRQFLLLDRNEDAAGALKYYNNNHNISEGKLTEGEKPSTVFMFSGQGTQYPGMTAQLYREVPHFKKIVDECAEKLKAHLNCDIRDILYRNENIEEVGQQLKKTEIAQPLLFTIEYALAKYLQSSGIKPESMIGHSLGEYVAATLSGVFTLEDALYIIANRGRIMAEAPEGAMLSVSISSEEMETHIADGYSGKLSIAVINSPDYTVVSGRVEDVHSLKDKLEKDGIKCRLLHNSRGFHSHMMEPVLESFRKVMESVKLQSPKIPFISNITGDWITSEEATSADYWVSHIRSSVMFSAGIKKLIEGDRGRLFLEIGPGNTLCSLLFLNQDDGNIRKSFSTIKSAKSDNSDITLLYSTIGTLWTNGVDIKWEALYNDSEEAPTRRKVHLPGYAFDRVRHWVDAQEIHRDGNHLNLPVTDMPLNSAKGKTIKEDKPEEGENKIHITSYEDLENNLAQIWSEILGIDSINRGENFFNLGGNSVMATQLISAINSRLSISISLRELFLHPTVHELTVSVETYLKENLLKKNISVSEKKSQLPILFPVQPNGTRPPLFLVAGAHENRYFDPKKMENSYEEDFLRYLGSLIPHLGLDQPIYGFRPRGLVAGEKPHKTVEEMATAYIKEMKTFKPKGPYLIGGECVGGLVAYEMAKQLNNSGDEVMKLLLMDTRRPGLLFSINERIVFLRRKVKTNIIGIFKNLIKMSFKDYLKFIGSGLSFALVYLLPLTKKLREQKRVRTGSYNYKKVLMRYRPTPYKGEVLHIMNSQWHGKVTSLGWTDECGHHFRNEIVPGDHVTRLTTYGDVTGKIIRETISEAIRDKNRRENI